MIAAKERNEDTVLFYNITSKLRRQRTKQGMMEVDGQLITS